MVLVLNELSYANAQSDNQAKVWYDTFFSLCLGIEKKFKTKVSLKFSMGVNENALHPEYSFMKWLTNQNKEDKSSVLLMLTKEQLIHDYPYYKAYQEEGKGLGFAYENDESLISFESSQNWLVNFIPVVQESLNENADIETEDLNLRNLHNIENSQFHDKFLENRLKTLKILVSSKISTGQELWDNRVELFPNLIFCDSTRDFLFESSKIIFKNLLKKFKEYDSYFADWINGDFDKNALSGNIRLESETRENDFANQLTVFCPDGESRLFTLHCNIGIWGYRVHFFPDTTSRKCIVGYVGKKIV